ncbi:16S rRNA (guanine(527)-N(7))-methyltransferase RsmG [Neisseria sp. Ec49-e6-T10]|uniref:16S rRNA (guanine(527)-N(7))-methyltransferase RsmG n=1 Tax=Neisseria sp. Ec49-e6-T10 TaxID=3140744 RepID=UPI003EBBC1AA
MNTQETLQQGLKELNLVATDEQQDRLLGYLALLLKWNSTYNLTALRTEEKMLSHHIIDSLSLVPFLPASGSMIDVGSGGGMPGIPCAIMYPDLKVTLLDSNHKKTTFLRQVVIELGLNNVQVENCRVESLENTQFDIVTSRAFAEIKDFVSLTRQLLAKEGEWLAMKGVYPFEEIESLPEDIQVGEVISLNVPFVDGERHLVRLHKKEL